MATLGYKTRLNFPFNYLSGIFRYNFFNETDVSVRSAQKIREVIKAWPNGFTAKGSRFQLATTWESVWQGLDDL